SVTCTAHAREARTTVQGRSVPVACAHREGSELQRYRTRPAQVVVSIGRGGFDAGPESEFTGSVSGGSGTGAGVVSGPTSGAAAPGASASPPPQPATIRKAADATAPARTLIGPPDVMNAERDRQRADPFEFRNFQTS